MKQVVIFLALIPAAVSAQNFPDKPPWDWSVQERIAKRTDPEMRAARRMRDLSSVRVVAAGWSPINGAYEPELFLPFELLSRLMRAADPRDPLFVSSRAMYRQDIVAAGWDYDEFWRDLESFGTTYLDVWYRAGESQRTSLGHADLTVFEAQICAARTVVLARARQKYGAAFDRFLYTAVARTVFAWYDDKQDTAQILSEREKPCEEK
jgi:hypothetical protein